jgi:hypothetical protein
MSDAEAPAAELFLGGGACELEVCEESAFGNPKFLSLGKIRLFPSEDTQESRLQAVRHGAFEWRTPDVATATAVLEKSLGFAALKGDALIKARDKLRRFLDSLGGVPVRLGLVHPCFDPRSLERMPYSRPTTIIADTSGVLQGGLSFVARYLFPAVRIKVPAVVQMEIVNFADRFLNNRRSDKVKPTDLLLDHVRSQAAQRVLLQLELHSDVELERTFLLGDPLRGTFQRDEDKELRELNLNTSLRAYADRLILEAARQHQSQVSFGHPVMLLTSDQGLARMAMAEGLEPVYFKSAKASSFFGRLLTGATLHPFSGAVGSVGLLSIVWELATCFGCCRLRSEAGHGAILVHAIGKDLAWAPYHSHDDLLWLEAQPAGQKLPLGNAGIVAVNGEGGQQELEIQDQVAAESGGAERKTAPAARAGLYKFNVPRLFRVIDLLETEQELAEAEVLEVAEVRTPAALADYRRFLESGSAVSIENGVWKAQPKLRPVAAALRSGDMDQARSALGTFPSFAALQQKLQDHPVGHPFPLETLGRASATYQVLAEASGLGANVYGYGFFATPSRPSDQDFAAIALRAFEVRRERMGCHRPLAGGADNERRDPPVSR